ncbi:MAG: glycosyltransferase family 4 protein [Beijerinckiaceae bacterium]
MSASILVVMKGYPRLSETFIAQELLSLERAGFSLHIASLRHPTDKKSHPVHREIVAPVTYLPEYLHDAPARVAKAFFRALWMPGFAKAAGAFLKDIRQDFTRNRVRRFGQAMVLAAEMPQDVGHLYAHFIHTPASVTRYASLLTGLPWSCSAHAKDIWTTPDQELSDKLDSTLWTATCTEFGQTRLNALSRRDNAVRLIYHGLDLKRFRPLLAPASQRNGDNADKPVRLLTVARAVEKKGLDVLISALAKLPRELHWHWTHIGGGAQTEALKALAHKAGLDDRCLFRGACAQDEVLAAYGDADIFTLPCRIADDGDRDGLPNVLMEAASQGLAIVSTSVAGVGELIEHDRNGLLVAPDEPDRLSDALHTMIRNPALRFRLARAGVQTVQSRFDHARGIKALVALFRENAIFSKTMPEMSMREAAE